MDNKKEQTELKATNIISLFHPKKKKKIFFFGKKAGRHFGFLKKAGRHQKGAGRRALQKRPRQNTDIDLSVNIILYSIDVQHVYRLRLVQCKRSNIKARIPQNIVIM